MEGPCSGHKSAFNEDPGDPLKDETCGQVSPSREFQVSVLIMEPRRWPSHHPVQLGFSFPGKRPFLSPVLQAAGYLPQADVGCSESALTMALSHWLTRWVGERGAGGSVWQQDWP